MSDKPKKKNAAALALSKLRWQDKTPEERRAFMMPIQKLSSRKHKDKEHCPCGKMTLKRAMARAGKEGTSYGHRPGCPFHKREPRGRAITPRRHGSKELIAE
jgi:hypothetical protein